MTPMCAEIGVLYRKWRLWRHDAAAELSAWQKEAKEIGAEQAAALAAIYYTGLASLTPGGDVVVTVHDIGEDGFNWSHLISMLPVLAMAGKFRKASLTISIAGKGSKAGRILEVPKELLGRLGKLNKKARDALIAKVKRAKSEQEALKILEEGVSGGAATRATTVARQAKRVKPPLPAPVAEVRVTNMKGRDHPHPNHVKAAQSEEAAARMIHAMEDEIVLRWGKPMSANGPDIISYNYSTKKITLWDDKYRSRSQTIKPSKTFADDTDRLRNSIEEARDAIRLSNLSAEDKSAAFQCLQDTTYNTTTLPSGNARLAKP